MNTITETLKSVAPNTSAVISTTTDVKMNKKDVDTKTVPNPYLGAVRIATIEVTLNPAYEAKMNEALVAAGKEPNFVAGERAWGKNIGNGIVEHNDKLYASYIQHKTVKSVYIFNGKEIDYELLRPFISVVKEKLDEHGDVAVKIDFRTVAIENITAVGIS